ncbi:MAG: polysaccharide biosynthesis tyrosine autokinase [Hyphomicrobium sp.]
MSNANDAYVNGSRGSLAASPQPGEAALSTRDPYAGGGSYGSGFAPEPVNYADTIKEYWRIVNRRRWLIFSILGTVLTLGTIRTLLMTPQYTATVRIQIDRSVAKVVEGGNLTPVEGTDTEFLRTHYELLQSRNLAERVVTSTNLGSDGDFLKPQGFSLLGAILGIFSRNDATKDASTAKSLAADSHTAVDSVMANISVRPIPGSRLVDLSYTDPVPGRAQRTANAYADSFIASNLDKRFEVNAYAKTFLEDQLKQLKVRLEESENNLLDFAQKEKILEVTDKSSVVEGNLIAANAALGSLISERVKNEQMWKQVEQTSGMDLPQILTSGVIDGLRTKRNELSTEYKDKLETFKPGYPAMTQIQNRINEIDRQLASEVKTIRASLKAAYESSLNQENEIKARIETLKNEALDLQKRSIQYNIRKREVDTNRGLYNGLLQRFKEVDVAGGVGANNIFIVDKAELPVFPTSPRVLRSILLSFMIGLGLAVGAAVMLEMMDDVIVSIEDVERIASLSMLGIIPKTQQVGGAEAELADPRSPMSEAYRSLCTSLQFATEHGLPRTLTITSSGPGEGKSITSMAIAQHFARMGLKVLLVDADLRNPSLHKKMKVDNSIGLSNYLTGGCTPPEAFLKSDIPNLALMASGPLPPNAADLLSGSRLLSLLRVSLEVFDLIMIDGPPVLGLADAPILANAAEATVFVVGAGQARKASVRGALKRLEFSKSPIIGTILTKFDAKNAGYGYGYGYGYGNYSYTYGASSLGSTKDSKQLGSSGTEKAA